MGNLAQRMSAKAGGLADVSASLVNALHKQGARVHVALPNYAKMFAFERKERWQNALEKVNRSLPEQRIHLAEDAAFYRRSEVYDSSANQNVALAFQREVINHVIPQVQPDLIHCNDWMTGLIPAVAKHHGIRSLFTVHNIHTERLTLARMEDKGIDAEEFWNHCYFLNHPGSYGDAREQNPVDLLTTGIFCADHVNTVSPTFLSEVVDGNHDFVPEHIVHEIRQKDAHHCASGILNAPDDSFDPETDPYLEVHFGADDHASGKEKSKSLLQQRLGLPNNPNAPVLFWPSRLYPVQKGPQLLADILPQMMEDYRHLGLQVAIIANGSFQGQFHELVHRHQLRESVAVCDFSEALSHLGYAGSDFMLMPSRFEPCGLPQMVSPKYGTLTVAHDTGGIHDTVQHLNVAAGTGNGFLFRHFDAGGLRWAIDEALRFYQEPAETKNAHRSRIMLEAKETFNHETTARAYIERYAEMLGTPVTATQQD